MSGNFVRVTAAAAIVLSACAAEAPPAEELAGNCVGAHGAQLCTFAKVQGDAVLEVGTVVPMAAIENSPNEVPMAWPPAEVATVNMPAGMAERAGVSHMTMYWEPTGHPPVAYMVPHFDFHFYRIADAERVTIDCSDETKPTALPAAYSLPDETLPDEIAAMIGVKTLIGVCVPQMGMHSLLTQEIESQTPFRSTMVVGYYHGEPIFVEPMISYAQLAERKSFDLPIPTVPGLKGAHPTTFHAEYDAATDAYRFVFSGFAPAM